MVANEHDRAWVGPRTSGGASSSTSIRVARECRGHSLIWVRWSVRTGRAILEYSRSFHSIFGVAAVAVVIAVVAAVAWPAFHEKRGPSAVHGRNDWRTQTTSQVGPSPTLVYIHRRPGQVAAAAGATCWPGRFFSSRLLPACNCGRPVAGRPTDSQMASVLRRSTDWLAYNALLCEPTSGRKSRPARVAPVNSSRRSPFTTSIDWPSSSSSSLCNMRASLFPSGLATPARPPKRT
jgi:hypothetical protein